MVNQYDPQQALFLAKKSQEAYASPTNRVKNASFIIEKLPDRQILVFAGTENWMDCVEDLEAPCVERAGIGRICDGDADKWDECRDTILASLAPSIPVQTSGHSQAGSLAVIAALELHNRGFKVLDTYTFGSKRTGDNSWKRAWDSSGLVCKRFVNNRDPVPDLEGWLPHVGERIGFGDSGIPLIFPFHQISEYVRLLI